MEPGKHQSEVSIETVLRDTVMRLRSVVETAVDGIITIDERGIIDSVNPAGAKMFGYQPFELIGRNVSMLMPRPYSVEHDQYLVNYLTTGKKKIIGIGRDLTGLRKDGTTFPMRLAVSEMQQSDRRHFTGIVSDLTERRQLERQVLESAAAEQRRIGQDLHDGLCQQLAALGMSIEMLRRKWSPGAGPDPAQLAKIQQLLHTSIAQLRQVAHGLQPVNFRLGGLPDALRELAESTSERFHVACRARCSPRALIQDRAVADHLYRIAQEAVGNAVKHGKASNIRIGLKPAGGGGGILLAVIDDGVGFPAAIPTTAGMGLRIMKYRADAIGGDFRVRPRRSGGSAVCCVLPPKS